MSSRSTHSKYKTADFDESFLKNFTVNVSWFLFIHSKCFCKHQVAKSFMTSFVVWISFITKMGSSVILLHSD